MHRFIDGEDRMQQALLPHSLEDYVSEENPVRVIEVFIDELGLAALGFSGLTPAATGRPGYHPSTLLKIYLYGYLNRLQSSRRLEREAQRNIELMWLTGRLAPDFKTIADFRKDNGAAIRAVCAQFVVLCRQLGLFARAVVAIDGSKFKAVNDRDKNYTVAKVTGRMEQVDASIARYLRALDRADREEGDVAEAKSSRLKEKIAGLRQQMQALKVMAQTVQDAPDQRQRHRHRRLQCTDRRRRRIPPDRGPRGEIRRRRRSVHCSRRWRCLCRWSPSIERRDRSARPAGRVRPEPSAPSPSRRASAGASRQSSPSAGPTWPRRYRPLRGRLGPAPSGNARCWHRPAPSAR